MLPADVEWGVNVPNPTGRSVVIKNAKGIVCWDVKSPGLQSCSGPPGNGGAAGTGFLAEDKPAGALIIRTREGRTWLSVNGRGASAFKANEGFYEFDLDLK